MLKSENEEKKNQYRIFVSFVQWHIGTYESFGFCFLLRTLLILKDIVLMLDNNIECNIENSYW
jgi:hypothetical protein